MSQDEFGRALDITFQQVQRLESGRSRVGASRLFEISRVLEVPVAYFFDEMPAGVTDVPERQGFSSAVSPDTQPEFGFDRDQGESLELVLAYYRITDPNIRRRALEVVKAMAF